MDDDVFRGHGRFHETHSIRIAVAAGAAATLLAGLLATGQASAVPKTAASGPAGIEELSGGWSVPWGMDWLPDRSALYAERDTTRSSG